MNRRDHGTLLGRLEVENIAVHSGPSPDQADKLTLMPPIFTLAASPMPGSLAPAWIVLPIAAVVMLLLAGHVLVMARADMPASRRRIRTINGVLMLCTVPVLACAFGLVSPSDQRLFVMVWMLGAGMVLIVLGLACMDLMNNWRIARDERRKLLDEIRTGFQSGFHTGLQTASDHGDHGDHGKPARREPRRDDRL